MRLMVRGSAWSVLGELLVAGGRILSFFLYARLLSPTDFGLVGFCVLWINIFPLLIDNSLGFALIRSDAQDQRTYSTVFFLNLAAALAGIAVLGVGTIPAAAMIHDTRILYVLPALSIQLLCNAGCGTHMAIARKKFEFRRLFPVRLISTLCSIGAGFSFALLGYGFWALVASTLALGLSQMIASWLLLGWRPTFEFDRERARELGRFASWIAIDMTITWLVMSGGGFFLAYFLGTHELGLFRLSDQLDATLMGTIFTPLTAVFYSAFSRTAGGAEPQKGWDLMEQLSRPTAIAAFLVAGLIVCAAWPIEALIGTKWRGIGGVFIINAISDGISYLVILVPSFLRAYGKARIVAIFNIALLAVQIIAYLAAAPHGLYYFLCGKLVVDTFSFVAAYLSLRTALNFPIGAMLRFQFGWLFGASLCAATGLGAAMMALRFSPWLALFAGPLAFVCIMGGLVYAREKDGLKAILLSLLSSREGMADTPV